jgi:hypothetical protein
MMLFGKRDLVSLEGFFSGAAHGTLLTRAGGFAEVEEAWLAYKFLGDDKANFLKLTPRDEKKGVSVDQVRDLSISLNMGAKRGGERRLVLVNDSFELNSRAQNALLKIVEEPPEGVFFLFLAGSEDFLLPTIVSRCQLIKLGGPTSEEVLSYGTRELGMKGSEVDLLWLQAGKSAGEFLRYSVDEAARKKSLETLGSAKKFIPAGEYEKLIILKKYLANRVDALEFVRSLLVVIELVAKKGAKEALSLGALAEKAERAIQNLNANANARMELLNLVV